MEVVREACQRGGLLGSRAGPEHPSLVYLYLGENSATHLTCVVNMFQVKSWVHVST